MLALPRKHAEQHHGVPNSEDGPSSSLPGRVGVTRHPLLLAKQQTMSKSTSSPTLKQLGATARDGELEVYVVLKNFQEFGGGVFNKLPTPLRDGIRDTGICHYLTVFKQQDGTLIQFDFGPESGGDVHLSAPGPLGRIFNKSKPGTRQQRVTGQVREKRLRALPDSHMFMGTTNLTLGEIRAWNTIHAAPEYELHRSDCRHYVNALVRYTTGIERAAVSALRHQLARNRDHRSIGSQMIRLGHYFTDAANWDRVRAIGHATSAAIMTLAGQQTLARVGAAPLLQSVGSKIIPQSARGALVPVKKALFHRPVYAMSTAAVASTMATSHEVSMRAAPVTTLRNNVVRTVQTCVRAAASFADNVGKTAVASQHTATRAVSRFVQSAAGQSKKVVMGGERLLMPSSGKSAPEPVSMHHSGVGGPRLLSGVAVQQLALIATRR
jgi:hypothetical protein